MSRDNEPDRDEGRKSQARRLAEEALAASAVGDTQASDQLFSEAERRDPQAVEDVLMEDAADTHPPAVSRRVGNPLDQATGPVAWPPALGSGPGLSGPVPPPQQCAVSLEVNGRSHTLSVDTRATLLDALRDGLGLTGTKKGCALGQCGACTVLLDGRRINACLMLAVMAEGHAVTTIEGVLEDAALHPMQAAFVAHDAFQCGYCTPGQIMSAIGLLTEGRRGDDADIREQMSGNICRCGAYANIVDAIRSVRDGQGD
jgi:xanthine dehydrogenase YagT iron-sulfur-binding subunit